MKNPICGIDGCHEKAFHNHSKPTAKIPIVAESQQIKVDVKTVLKPIERWRYLCEHLAAQKKMVVQYEIKIRTMVRTKAKIAVRTVSAEVTQSVAQDLMLNQAGLATTVFDIESTRELMLDAYEKLTDSERVEERMKGNYDPKDNN